MRAGFIEAVVKLMVSAPRGPAAAAIMQEACRAFATLAFADSEGKAALRERGANRALTAAIDVHPMDMKVQEMGRSLLSAISGG